MKFPNKMILETYFRAINKVFTHSPSFHKFTDDTGSSDYNYSAMQWLLHNNYLILQPFDGKSIVYKYKLKD